MPWKRTRINTSHLKQKPGNSLKRNHLRHARKKDIKQSFNYNVKNYPLSLYNRVVVQREEMRVRNKNQ